MTEVVQGPRRETPDVQARPDRQQVVDALVEIVVESLAAGVVMVRTASRLAAPVTRLVWRPPLVPTALQPATVVGVLAQRGAAHRVATEQQVARLLDAWTPLVADTVLQRLDLDAMIHRVDLVAMVEEVIAGVDLPAIIRESSGTMASETVRGVRMTGISADEAISRTLRRPLFRRGPRAVGPLPEPT
jgi:hypothetical protein